MVRSSSLFALVLLVCSLPAAFATRTCVPPDQAPQHAEKEICVAAHVYDVVEVADGTRYLDVCKPDVPDESCRFTVISLPMDRKEVGDLSSYRDQDVQIRGTVHVVRGQSTILLSHARQFKDGAEKFRPNPALMAGFSAENGSTAFHDPAMSARRHKGSSAFKGTAK